jgi:selenocysteine lyase/cysteine desulfurase
VVSTRLEHNSVLRPLHHLREAGLISYDLVPFDGQGFVDPQDFSKAVRPNTRLAILCHASNVLGSVQPAREIGRLCAERDVPLVIDAAQSAGQIPIPMDEWQVAAVAFTGHKSLMGPTGIGGLALHPDLDVQSTRFGGTGIDSRSLVHTQTLPHRLEAGTLNLMGIIGLSAGVDFLKSEGMEVIHEREMELLRELREGLSEVRGVELICAGDLEDHVGILTFNLKGMAPDDLGTILDGDFGVMARVGLHCAPLVHDTVGTYPQGAVRFSLGPFNTRDNVERTIAAVEAIAATR